MLKETTTVTPEAVGRVYRHRCVSEEDPVIECDLSAIEEPLPIRV